MIATSEKLADDQFVELTPLGYRFAMIWVALVKRVLLADSKLPATDKLAFLEGMNQMPSTHLDEQMLRLIEPASDAECALVHEAVSLDKGASKPGDRLHGSFAVLTDDRVFRSFVSMNVGIAGVIRQWKQQGKPSHAD